MKIIFLGTGTSLGIPVIGGKNHPVCSSSDKRDRRLRSSIAIQWGYFRYIIDCGPDFRYQMLRADIEDINGILFTHEHADHTAGLDDIRPFFYKMGPVPIYANRRVLNNLVKRYEYIFTDMKKYPGSPCVVQNEIKNNSITLGNIKVTPIEIMHGKLQILGYRFADVAYLTDVKTIPDKEFKKLSGLRVLIISMLRINPHPTHLNLEEAISIIDKVKPDVTYFTHISQDLGFQKEISMILPANVFLAYDTLEIEV